MWSKSQLGKASEIQTAAAAAERSNGLVGLEKWVS